MTRVSSKKEPNNRVEHLLSSVFERPDDDQLRLVLSDALQEAGDPRGEFIAEQHRRLVKGVANPTKKERALQKSHRDAWLGGIAPALKSESFRLGFVSSATLRGGRLAFGKLLSAREWRTLEHVVAGTHRNVGSISPETAAEILAGPNLDSLRVVSQVSIDVLMSVVEKRKTLGWRTLHSVQIQDPMGDFLNLVALDNALPALTHLGCEDVFHEAEFEEEIGSEHHHEFLSSKFASRLEFLSLRTSLNTLEELAATAIKHGIRNFDFGCSEFESSDARLRWDGKSRTLTMEGEVEPSIGGIRIIRAE